ncbi:hypothetical protein IT072_11015 [Leifsonia sp. ZF2019]|uniref:hypothetical protein n=1 Tax=Leifsonia sp. ZF2019 TaxID=2781978 RepID=UPI001CBC7FED|nr:hypothetical protein [Leifsonia sp. ZF2019]UAJ77836.1 hypothetical protein IT072_11015 [Leifsonia sp. ZF2019]
MPWWSWLLIWTGLVLGLIGMLAYFAWSLFRKVVAAAKEAGALIEKAEVLQVRADELKEEAFHSAVFADAAELRAGREQSRADKEFARQARRDARVRRGKLLVKADPSRFEHVTRRTS